MYIYVIVVMTHKFRANIDHRTDPTLYKKRHNKSEKHNILPKSDDQLCAHTRQDCMFIGRRRCFISLLSIGY